MLGLLSVLFFFANHGTNPYQVVLQPLDVKPNAEMFPLRAIHQLESDGQHLFLRNLSEARVLVLNRQGEVLRELGRKGMGPGEWGTTGIQAFALFQHELWGFGTHHSKITGYVNGTFHKSFKLISMKPGHLGATSNVFAVSDTHLVIPSPSQTTHLAQVYSKTGQALGPTGTRLVEEENLLSEKPFSNDTLWVFNGNRWFALFKFFPVIAVFDKQLQSQTFFNLDHSWITAAFAHVSDDHGPDIALPLFSDFKVFGENLFLMCRGGLLQVSAETLEVKTLTRFVGKGADFGRIAGEPVTLPFFTFLHDGTLVLTHPMALWNHDLWTVPSASLNHFKTQVRF